MASPDLMAWYEQHEHDHIPINVDADGHGPLNDGDPEIADVACLECGEHWPCGVIRVNAAIAIAARPINLEASP